MRGGRLALGAARSSSWLALLVPALITLCTTAQAQQSLTLAWDLSLDPSVAGYNVYYGGTSGTYTNMTSAGNAPQFAITGLLGGTTYFFVVTAYDASGDESPFSDEIMSTIPILPQLQFNVAPGGTIQLTGAGPVGHTYEIQATTDFGSWTVVGTQTLDSSGSFNFTDPDAASYPARFYRLRDVLP